MAARSIEEVTLISIHPEFVEKIFNGTKRVEFRKKYPGCAKICVVYATDPVQRIVGLFKVDAVHVDTPKTIWKRFMSVGGIDFARYSEYYSRHEKAVAIEIKSVLRFKKSVRIDFISKNTHPPQSYMYLNESARSKMDEILNNRDMSFEKMIASC